MSMLQNFAPLPFASLRGFVHWFVGGFWVLPSTAGSQAAITRVFWPIKMPPLGHPLSFASNCWLIELEPPPPFSEVQGDIDPAVPPAQPSLEPHAPAVPLVDSPEIHGNVDVLAPGHRVAPPTCSSTNGRSPGLAAGSYTMTARSPAFGQTN